MVITAGVVHGLWGLILCFNDAPLHTTPMGHIPLRGVAAGMTYILVSVLAFAPHIQAVSGCIRRYVWKGCPKELDTHFAGLVMTLPQQGLLMMSFFTAAISIVRGQYPDGYVPNQWGSPHLFILVDQLWSMLGMVFHTAALLDWYWLSRLPDRR